MDLQRTLVRLTAGLVASLAACEAPIPHDLQPSIALDDTETTPASPLRLVGEAEYTGHGPVGAIGFDPRTGAIMPAGFTGTPRTSFYTQEGIIAVADITWAESGSYGGIHAADWRLFGSNALLKEKRTDERLATKPARIISHISAGSFPPGKYRLELLLDQKPFGAVPFTILAAEIPPPLPVAIGGPTCTSTGASTGASTGTSPAGILPISRLRPEYPMQAAEHNVGGCAAVSVIIDNAGHASGVRVDAEYPKDAGFGAAVAKAAAAAIFPPGHGGETAHIHVNFNPPR
jgi:hypothetical protein